MSDKKKNEEIAAVIEMVKKGEVKHFVQFAQKYCSEDEILEIVAQLIPSANFETCEGHVDENGNVTGAHQHLIYTGVEVSS